MDVIMYHIEERENTGNENNVLSLDRKKARYFGRETVFVVSKEWEESLWYINSVIILVLFAYISYPINT